MDLSKLIPPTLLDKLDRGHTVQSVARWHIFLIYIIYPFRRIYARRYNSKYWPTSRPRDTLPAIGLPEHDTQAPSDQKDLSSEFDADYEWKWRGVPKLPRKAWWGRFFTTAVMAYIVAKNLIESAITLLMPSSSLLEKLPCYFVGRFVIQFDVQQLISFMIASFNLGWRVLQVYYPNQVVASVMCFLILDSDDIEHYYELLKSDERHELRVTTANRKAMDGLHDRLYASARNRRRLILDAREQFFHDVMSFKVDYGRGPRYELRPNRTRDSGKVLRQFFMVWTILDLLSLISLVFIVAVIVPYRILNVKTYLKHYPGCSPEVHRLDADGKLPSWSFQMVTAHQYIALAADALENFVIYFESGLVGVLDMSLIATLNLDLYLYLCKLDKEIQETLEMVALDHHLNVPKELGDTLRDQNGLRSTLMFQEDRQITERIVRLQMQLQDMIKEINRTDGIITDSYTCILAMWFFTFAYCVYKLQSVEISAPIYFVLLTVLSLVLFFGIVILIIQRILCKSYARICSLMAHDRSEHKRNFIRILDYFVKHRTCFTICRGYPMRSSTLLTIIGYSFSCFFIVGSMNNRLH